MRIPGKLMLNKPTKFAQGKPIAVGYRVGMFCPNCGSTLTITVELREPPTTAILHINGPRNTVPDKTPGRLLSREFKCLRCDEELYEGPYWGDVSKGDGEENAVTGP